MHFSYNFSGGHIGGMLGLVPGTVLYIAGGGLVVMAIAVVVIFGRRHLSRRPLADLPIQPSASLSPTVAAPAPLTGQGGTQPA
jgi:hypothetical protein